MKICLVGVDFFPCVQTDGQTEMAKVIVAFRNFANAPEKGSIKPLLCRFVWESNELGIRYFTD
jgi:hypothetical protein